MGYGDGQLDNSGSNPLDMMRQFGMQDDPNKGFRRGASQNMPSLWESAPFDMTKAGNAIGGGTPNAVSATELEQNDKKSDRYGTQHDPEDKSANPSQGQKTFSLDSPPSDEQLANSPRTFAPPTPDQSSATVAPSSAGSPNSPQYPDVSGRLQKVNDQIDQMNQPLSVKRRIFNALITAAPVAIAGAFGGIKTAGEVAGGESSALQRMQTENDAQRQGLVSQAQNLTGVQERQAQAQSTDQFRAQQLGLMKRPEILQTDDGPIQFDAKTQTWGKISVDGQPVSAPDKTQRFKSPAEGYAAAVSDAISRKVDPNTDPTVQQWKSAALGLQKSPDKPDTPAQQFIESRLKAGRTIEQATAEYAAATQKPERDQRQLAVGPDGTVMELRPGMKVPQGSKTMAGDLAGAKPSADEQKRADLVENLNENLDQLEDIVRRRPELFGSMAGRMTKLKEWAGSSDPDVAALKGIEDRLGMVQQSSHGMRSAQHVAASADSVLNGYKNGPDAMLRSIADARKSGKTFTIDAQRGRPQPAAGGENGNSPTPNTHDWSVRGWQASHPGQDANAASAAAKSAGYNVVP